MGRLFISVRSLITVVSILISSTSAWYKSIEFLSSDEEESAFWKYGDLKTSTSKSVESLEKNSSSEIKNSKNKKQDQVIRKTNVKKPQKLTTLISGRGVQGQKSTEDNKAKRKTESVLGIHNKSMMKLPVVYGRAINADKIPNPPITRRRGIKHQEYLSDLSTSVHDDDTSSTTPLDPENLSASVDDDDDPSAPTPKDIPPTPVNLEIQGEEVLETAKALTSKDREDVKNVPGTKKSEDENDADLAIILEGVREVGCKHKCRPGMLAVYGYDAFTVLAGRYSTIFAPVVAAANFGLGRIVAFADEKFMTLDKDQFDTDKLLVNLISWASRNTPNSPPKTAWILDGENVGTGLTKLLNETGYLANLVEHEMLLNPDLNNEMDVLIVPDMFEVKTDVIENLKTYVINGGSVVAACTSTRDDFTTDFPGNEFLKESGMVWVPKATKTTTHWKDMYFLSFNVSKVLLRNTHAGWVAQEVIKYVNSPDIPEVNLWGQMKTILSLSLLYATKSEIPWIDELKDSLQSIVPLNPSVDNPIESCNYTQFNLSLELMLYDILDPDEMPVHPSAAHFPGQIQQGRAIQIEDMSLQTIVIPVRKEKFKSEFNSPSYGYSTGLYAPAGSPISVKIDASHITQFDIIIGIHKDDFTNKPNWIRFPKITTSQTFSGNTGNIASPFGGLIYIQHLESSDNNNSITNLTVGIKGAISTPSFFMDKTSLRDWKDSIRHIKAPWAEFVSDRIALSIPGDLAGGVEDPEEMLTFWREVINQMADFAASPRNDNFQRIAFDLDVAEGYMTMGKPIMAQLPSAPNLLNISSIQRPTGDTWAFLHVLGHMYQEKEWTLEGGTEVTGNIFAMYILNLVCWFPMNETNELFQPVNVKKAVEGYIKKGSKYKEHFIKDKDLGLLYYYQLQIIFGWGAYRRVFKAYRELPEIERPIKEDKKLDKWLVIFSTSVERNLVGLFRSWGMSFSAEAEEQVEHLPDCVYNVSSLLDL